MKTILTAFSALLIINNPLTAQVDVSGTVNSKTNEKLGQAIDKVWEAPGKAKDKKKEKNEKTGADSGTSQGNGGTVESKKQGDTAVTKTSTAPSIKAYQNYDFVQGEKIIFEDNFLTDADGEFPAHWELKSGQATINKLNGEPALYITDGNYGTVAPRMKQPHYLAENFTIEFDYYNFRPEGSSASYPIVLRFSTFSQADGYDRNSDLSLSASNAGLTTYSDVSLNKDYPPDIFGDDAFCNKWHHVAIAFKNKQMKVYIDQFRVLVVPDTKTNFQSLSFNGIGSDQYPIIFRNVRLAEGGGMNMLNKLLTDGRFVTHAINFDVNKSTIKPESMGFLNELAKFLKENPAVKLEIDGHTDSDGDDASNLKLSKSRADAVKVQLVSMGVEGARLSTQGLGESKPVDSNASPEGKANNRRVEFIKQ